jgi:hypothetical protein
MIDQTTGDAALDAAVEAAEDPRAPVAARIDGALAYLAGVRHDPEQHVLVGSLLTGALQGELDELRARARSAGRGPEAADLLGLLCEALVSAGWAIRGNDLAKNVAKEAWGPFLALLAEADEVGAAALGLVPDHAHAACSRMMTALGLGLGGDFGRRFEVARRSRPTLYPAHWFMLTGSCAKWFGSDERMWAFAAATVEHAPPGDPLTAMLALAHYEHRISLRRRELPRREVDRTWRAAIRSGLPDLVAASDRWLEGPARPHPRDFEAHQLFGWVFQQGGDHERARGHLELGTLQMATVPWRDADHFADTLSELQVVPRTA